MKKTLTSLFRHPLDYLLLLVPLTVIAWLMSWGDLWVFSLAALGIIPLARYIGVATEALAVHTGPRLGGFLNATLGNAAELIITIAAIRLQPQRTATSPRCRRLRRILRRNLRKSPARHRRCQLPR